MVETNINIVNLQENGEGGGEGKSTSVTSQDNSVDVKKTETDNETQYDLSIERKLVEFKTTDPDMREAIESAKMAHLYIVDNSDGSKKMARMFSQYTPYSNKYTETRIGLYAILRQEEKILGAGHFILSYWYKGGNEGVDLLYHGLAGEKNVADYIKVKHIKSVTSSQQGEICLYADFGDLNIKSCSISFSVNARNSLTYFDFSDMNKSVNYEADYEAKPMAENLGGFSLWGGTQTEYDAIATKDANTLYHITE